MPNWCTTEYLVLGKKKDVESVKRALVKVMKTDRSYEKNQGTFLPNSNWLGYVVKDVLGKSYDEVDCRGSFEISPEILKEDGKYCLRLCTWTAWAPCNTVFKMLQDKFNVEIFFQAEELGMGLLTTNDTERKYFPEFFITDSGEDDIRYADYNEMINYVSKLTGTKPSNYEEARKLLEDVEDVSIYHAEIESL